MTIYLPVLIVGLIITFSECSRRQIDENEQLETKATKVDSTSLVSEECNNWLGDSTLITGDFVRYIRDNGVIRIKWGNKKFERVLGKQYECKNAPHWIPTIEWSTPQYIGLKYGCGNPCWGLFILPLNPKDSVIERMYDFDVDPQRNLIVYLSDDDKSLNIENWQTGKIQTLKTKISCEPAFLGYCIDSIRFVNNELYIKWDELGGHENTKREKVDRIKLEI